MEASMIIKALECCSGNDCRGCPYFGHIPCTKPMKDDALALIEELTEENKKLGIDNFELICELSRIKTDTLDNVRNEFAIHVGTYKPDATIKISEVFELLNEIKENIIKERNNNEN